MDNKAKNTNSSHPQQMIPIEEFSKDEDGLYEDKTFLKTLKTNNNDVIWKRAKKISTNPKFFVEGCDRFDVKQGALGDCWFLSVLDNLTLHPEILFDVVPMNQNFDDKYNGAFHFKFYHNNTARDVWIDDYLPIDKNNELFFAKSSEKNEFWSALLEKAFAKFYYKYEVCPYYCLDGNFEKNAMKHLMQTVVEEHNIPEFNKLLKANEAGSIITFSIGKNSTELQNSGLIGNHAYSVTRVARIKIPMIYYKNSKETESYQFMYFNDYCKKMNIPNNSDEFENTKRKYQSGGKEFPYVKNHGNITNLSFKYDVKELVRIRNPHGNAFEWKGAWSDKSEEWEKVFDDDKDNVRFVKRPDGEFWMSYKDVQKHFSRSTICYKGNNQNETQKNSPKNKEKTESKNNSASIDNKPKTTGTKTL